MNDPIIEVVNTRDISVQWRTQYEQCEKYSYYVRPAPDIKIEIISPPSTKENSIDDWLYYFRLMNKK